VSDITRAKLVRLICTACRRSQSAYGMTIGQWHKGCCASPRGKLVCEHEGTARNAEGQLQCSQCRRVIE